MDWFHLANRNQSRVLLSMVLNLGQTLSIRNWWLLKDSLPRNQSVSWLVSYLVSFPVSYGLLN
jgi:hypothetical protein